MDNKIFGMTFLAVATSALLFFGVANAGAFAVDHLLFPKDEFGENTYIGTAEVSDMEVASAVSLVSQNFDTWRQNAKLTVTYQDASAEYPLETVQILLEETVGQAETGVQNTFVFELQEEATQSFLQSHFSVADFSKSDIKVINEKLALALAGGQSETYVNISDDSLSVQKVVISESAFSHKLVNNGTDNVIEALNGLQLAPGENFSFLDFINEQNVTEITDAELTEIASLIYSTALKTNLAVVERSIGSVQPVSVPLGQEAAINRKLGIDLVITNTNNSSYTLNIEKNNTTITGSLSAMPLVNDYVVQIGGETKVKPRLIKQYSAFVTAGKSVKEEGSEGVRVEVSRAILSNGEEVSVEPVSTDFYPPVHRVEIYPLAKPVSETPANGTVPGRIDPNNPDSTTNDPADPDSGDGKPVLIVEDPDNPGYDLDGNPIIYDEKGNIVSEDPNRNIKDTEMPVYDKGGNLTNP